MIFFFQIPASNGRKNAHPNSALIRFYECIASQQTRDIAHVLVQCWATVCDAGPALNQHMGNVPCLLGLRNICLVLDFTAPTRTGASSVWFKICILSTPRFTICVGHFVHVDLIAIPNFPTACYYAYKELWVAGVFSLLICERSSAFQIST